MQPAQVRRHQVPERLTITTPRVGEQRRLSLLGRHNPIHALTIAKPSDRTTLAVESPRARRRATALAPLLVDWLTAMAPYAYGIADGHGDEDTTGVIDLLTTEITGRASR
ncbi:hypothetical protein [Acrocarpospora sp. B8E8]|uniref:hypothetical protein n=1 Tax=Acrocarpospora sp. B8E8 TaxID=3153572 RepID=UPI00325D8D90